MAEANAAPEIAGGLVPAASPLILGRVLALIESAAGGKEIARYIVTHRAPDSPTAIVLLGVRPAPEVVRSRGVLLGRVLTQLEQDARAMVAEAAATLSGSGIEVRSETAITSDPADVMAAAYAGNCTSIIVSPPRAAGRAWSGLAAANEPGLSARIAGTADIPIVSVPRGGRW